VGGFSSKQVMVIIKLQLKIRVGFFFFFGCFSNFLILKIILFLGFKNEKKYALPQKRKKKKKTKKHRFTESECLGVQKIKYIIFLSFWYLCFGRPTKTNCLIFCFLASNEKIIILY